MSDNDTIKKLERIAERLLKGIVIPFIGAGVSYNAVHEDPVCEEKIASTPVMIQRVTDAIAKARLASDGKSRWGQHCCQQFECAKAQANAMFCNYTADKCRLSSGNLDQLCEMYIWIEGDYERLVNEVLRISKFTRLYPLPAHRYIAFVAREGLISEVITTNYDTCLEKAYRESFSDMSDKAQEECVKAITDLEEYRSYATCTSFFWQGRERTLLTIYKINGCAGKYKKAQDRVKQTGTEQNSATVYKASSILLAASQLQDWRERQWARDLFRDRLRSRTLLFSGFGSDEPQVKHTMMQIVEEFNKGSGRESMQLDGQYPWNKPNAPFICQYGETLSFGQTQILYAYAHVHNAPTELNSILANTFTGKDASSLNAGADKPELPADLFWQRLFQVTFWKLLSRCCQSQYPFCAYLSAMTPAARVCLQQMQHWYCSPDKPFGRFSEMVALENDKGQGAENEILPLMRWVRAVRFGDTKGRGVYEPLKERPVLIPLILLAIFLLCPEDEVDEWKALQSRLRCDQGMFRVKAPFKTSVLRDQWVLFTHSEAAFENRKKVDLPGEIKTQGTIIQVILNNDALATTRQIHIWAKPDSESSEKGYRRITVYQIPFRKLIVRQGVPPGSVLEIRRNVVHELQHHFRDSESRFRHLNQRATLLRKEV